MPRAIPKYEWPVVSGEPLKAERHSHRMKGKSKGKGFKSDTIPRALPSSSAGFKKDVHFGSHKRIEHQIRDEMLRMGL
jgi:hypothetical protein